MVGSPSIDGEYGAANFNPGGLNAMLEAQSKRIAQAIHDEAGQLLAAVFVRLDQAAREAPVSCGSSFQEIRQLLEMIESQLRELSHDLRPSILDDLGLIPALQYLTERAARRNGLEIPLASSIPGRLPPAVETALYRIVQESLTNVAKHAGASKVEIRLSQEGHPLSVSIRDNGVGFDVNQVMARKGSRGLGLAGIRERIESVGGTLSIHSWPGMGTELFINIPGGTKWRLV
jgi:signal transduction histidine kinase